MPTDAETKFAAEVEATIKTWRTTSHWGKYFHPCPYNWKLLFDKLQAVTGPFTVAKLDKANWILSTQGWDLTKDANPHRGKPAPETPEQREQRETAKAQQEQAARDLKAQQDAEAEKVLFESWWKPLPGENSLQTWQRANGLKESYMRKKYPRAVPDPNAVHPDTVRNTQHELKLRKAQADAQALSRATPPIQSPEPGATGAQLAFIESEESRAEAERNKS
jgi:hypothetical protein